MSTTVGIVIVTHDAYLKYLPRLLESLRCQTHAHKAIVVFNGTKHDRKLCEAYGVQMVHPAVPLSLGEAANFGVRMMLTDYIVRIDGDDWIAGDMILAEKQYLDDHEAVDCVWCDVIETRTISKSETHETVLFEPSEQTELINSCGAMYRRHVWTALGGYADRNHGENIDYWKRLHAHAFRAERIPRALYAYRQHEYNMHNDAEAVARARKEIDSE